MARQTAVQWLVKEFNLESYEASVKFALEKEKEQIVFSNYNGQSVGKRLIECDVHKFITKAEKYYNDTYGS